MKNLAIILTLLATLAIAGCGSSEKSFSAPAKAPSSSSTAVTEQTTDKAVKADSDAPAKKDFVMTELTKKTIKEKNVQVIDQHLSENGRTLITTFSDGTSNYESAKKTVLGNSGKDAKLGHFKPVN